MPEYGLTPKGFIRKPYTQIIADKEERARSFFGEDIDLSDRSPIGLYIQADSWEESRLWDEMENVYYSAYIDDAEGKQLDGLVKYIGLKRKPAQHAKGEIEIHGKSGKTIDAGIKIMTESGIIFQTTETVMLDQSGFSVVPVEAVDAGKSGNVTASKITKLFNTTEGIDRLSNPTRTGSGSETESDEDLRERYYRSLSRKGKATREAVEAALLEIENLKDAYVVENATTETVNGIPPKSLAPYVFGGDHNAIAAAILETKAGGIQSYGDTVVEIMDSRKYKHKIGFTEAESVEIYVRVELRKNTMFKPGHENGIRTAIIQYIGGMDADGTEHKGLSLGQAVMRSKIIALADDAGIDDLTVKLSSDGITYKEGNIDIPVMRIATTDYEKVVVA